MVNNEGMTYWVRYLVGILWAGVVSILLLLNNRLCSAESKQAEAQAEVVSLKKDIEYIKQGLDEQKEDFKKGMAEQKADIKEIAIMIRTLGK